MNTVLKYLVIVCVSVPTGVVVYFCIGVIVPRVLNTGRFYSVPFGGFKVGGQDWELFSSVIFWILLSFVAISTVINLTGRSHKKTQ